MPQTRAVRINGPALRSLREQRGLTVPQLAARAGRHPQSVRRLETGDGKYAGVVFAYQLANGLGLTGEDGQPDIRPIVVADGEPDEETAHGRQAA